MRSQFTQASTTSNHPSTLRLILIETMVAERQDILTVREFARLQGFEDSFRFYGRMGKQYDDVLMAQPPILGKLIANVVRSVSKGYRKGTIGKRSLERSEPGAITEDEQNNKRQCA